YVYEYGWQSDHEFVTYSSAPPLSLIKVDTRTGTTTIMEQLRRRLSNEENRPYINDYSFEVSPDGKRLLWAGEHTTHHWTVSAPLDGSSITKRRHAWGELPRSASNAIWMPNSRQWVQMLAGKDGLDAILEGLDSPD